MKLLLALSIPLFLYGCGGTFSGTKPGAGQAEFSNDFLECQMVSKRIYGNINSVTIQTCMQGKGWTMNDIKY